MHSYLKSSLSLWCHHLTFRVSLHRFLITVAYYMAFQTLSQKTLNWKCNDECLANRFIFLLVLIDLAQTFNRALNVFLKRVQTLSTFLKLFFCCKNTQSIETKNLGSCSAFGSQSNVVLSEFVGECWKTLPKCSSFLDSRRQVCTNSVQIKLWLSTYRYAYKYHLIELLFFFLFISAIIKLVPGTYLLPRNSLHVTFWLIINCSSSCSFLFNSFFFKIVYIAPTRRSNSLITLIEFMLLTLKLFISAHGM